MEDLTGRQFGNWKVIQYNGKSEWLCECQCEAHTLKLVRTYMLTSGNSKSCGCGRVNLQVKDLTNQTFGLWKVIEYAGNSKWLCECQCENHTRKIIAGRDLKSGCTKSCGCTRRKDGKPLGSEYSIEKKSHLKEDLTGKTFGNWIVKKYLGNYKWECECQCENHTVRSISRYDLIKGKSTNCGCKRHKDLTGKTFSRLYVRRYLGNMLWECECQCENHTVINVLTCNLLSGGTQSCGCLKNESTHSKEEYMEAINSYMKKYGDKPYLEDIANIIGLHKENVRHNINKYELNNYINKSFGSHYEHDIYNICKQYTEDIESRNRTVIAPLELDIYIPSKKLAIEFNGDYWHSSEKINKKYHQHKSIECAKKGIQLIHIFEYEWNDTSKQIKLEQLLKSKFVKPDNVIYARNTELRAVSDEESKEFLNAYHLQGYTPAMINLGLYKDAKLVSLITFGNPRFNNNYSYEIIRYCKHPDYLVIGGIEKLFKQFKDTYKPDSVITYADFSKFTGNIYTRIGFRYITQDPVTEPNYVWINEITGDVLTRYKTQKQKLIKLGLGKEDQSEKEIMETNGYIQIFDCGNIKLEWKNY